MKYLKEHIEEIENSNWLVPHTFLSKTQFLIYKFFSYTPIIGKKIRVKIGFEESLDLNLVVGYLKSRGVLEKVWSHEFTIAGIKYYKYNTTATRKIGDKNKKSTSWAIDTNRNTSLSKAVGEALERYFSLQDDSSLDKQILKKVSEFKIGEDFYYPQKLHRYLDLQYKKVKMLHDPKKNVEISWIPGFDLLENKKVLIPAQMINWGSVDEKLFGREGFLQDVNSNGCAGHFDLDTANLNGIYEIVERDSFLVHWLSKISPKQINITIIPEIYKKTIEIFKKDDKEILFFDITTDTKIPTVMSICKIKRKDNQEQITVSLSTNLSFERAFDKCFVDILVTQHFTKEEKSKKIAEPFISFISMTDRAALWIGDDIFEKIKWITEGESVDYNTLKDVYSSDSDSHEYIKVLEKLKSMGPDFYPKSYEYKHEILEKLGFHVVKVFILGLMSLYLTENKGTFDSDRLKNFAKLKGKENFELNKDVHPFV